MSTLPYTYRVVGRESAAWHTAPCTHGCDYIIQILGPDHDVQFEFCPLDAERFAGLLLEAIEWSHRSE